MAAHVLANQRESGIDHALRLDRRELDQRRTAVVRRPVDDCGNGLGGVRPVHVGAENDAVAHRHGNVLIDGQLPRCSAHGATRYVRRQSEKRMSTITGCVHGLPRFGAR